MKTSFLRQRTQRLVFLTLLVVGSSSYAQAASESPSVVSNTLAAPAPAPIQLVWDRVGAPIQIRV